MTWKCKLCYLKNKGEAVQKLGVEHIENWLRNTGYRKYPYKPLSFSQISYLAWEVFEIKVSPKTISKHYKICMGSPQRDVPISYYKKRGFLPKRYFKKTI